MKVIKCLAIVASISLANQVSAQLAEADSLRKLVSSAADDSFKVNNLILLSRQYFGTDSSLALQYSSQARDLSEKIEYKAGVAAALKNAGIVYYSHGAYMEALDTWTKAMHVYESIGDEVGVANMLSNIGAIYFNRGEDAKALEFHLRSLTVSEKTGNKLRIATALNNIGAVYNNKEATRERALNYFLQALPLSAELNDKDAIGTTAVNIGEIYLSKGNDTAALDYFKQSLKAFAETEGSPYTLNNIGKVYAKRGNFDSAVAFHNEALSRSKAFSSKLDIAQSLIGLGDTYAKKGDLNRALDYYQQSLANSRELNSAYEIKNAYQGIAAAYSQRKDFANAYKYMSLLTSIKDTLYNIETDRKLAGLLFDFEIQKKQSQIDILTKNEALQQLELKRQKLATNALVAVLILGFAIAFIMLRSYRNKVRTNQLLDRQNMEIQRLLLNILPAEVARELQRDGVATPRYYDSVSVLFTDFRNFSKLADNYSPQELVKELNEYFMAFDEIIERYNLEKIKTIGDAYMCAGGIPTGDEQHPLRIVEASLEIQEYIRGKNQRMIEKGVAPWDLRIGIHTGPVVAGVVGKKKYAYDIWGSTVNIANRMESNGEPGQVNISESTYNLVKDRFSCIYRGKISAKNVGEIDMYFVQDDLPKN